MLPLITHYEQQIDQLVAIANALRGIRHELRTANLIAVMQHPEIRDAMDFDDGIDLARTIRYRLIEDM